MSGNELEDSDLVMEDSEESSSEEDEGQLLRNQLADMPLGELQKVKEQVGLKKYNEAVLGAITTKTVKKDIKAKSVNEKSAPEEKSSKIRNFGPRKVVLNHSRRLKHDPRFDDLSGSYNEIFFEKSYAFLDDVRKTELSLVKKQLKKAKNQTRKDDLGKLLKRMERQSRKKEEQIKQREKDGEEKKKEAELIKSGKKVFYMKKSDRRKKLLVEKFQELKSTGKLENYMSKKRKRNAAKERKKLPFEKVQ